MGRPGEIPISQLGGAQEAVSVAPPRLLRAVALLAPAVLVVVVKAATSGLVVLQVSGGFQRKHIARGDAVEGVDGRGIDRNPAAVINRDRVPLLPLACDLQIDGFDQASGKRIGGAGGPG